MFKRASNKQWQGQSSWDQWSAAPAQWETVTGYESYGQTEARRREEERLKAAAEPEPEKEVRKTGKRGSKSGSPTKAAKTTNILKDCSDK